MKILHSHYLAVAFMAKAGSSPLQRRHPESSKEKQESQRKDISDLGKAQSKLQLQQRDRLKGLC